MSAGGASLFSELMGPEASQLSLATKKCSQIVTIDTSGRIYFSQKYLLEGAAASPGKKGDNTMSERSQGKPNQQGIEVWSSEGATQERATFLVFDPW